MAAHDHSNIQNLSHPDRTYPDCLKALGLGPCEIDFDGNPDLDLAYFSQRSGGHRRAGAVSG